VEFDVKRPLSWALSATLVAATAICASAPPLSWASAEEAQPQPARGVLSLLPPDSVTEHVLDTKGEKFAYTATAGTLALFNQDGEKSAAIFYTAYTVKGASAERPVTFVFNGGPGAASTYLHLGLAGPQAIDFGKGDGAGAHLRPNPNSWLKFTDLVMIDPVGSGWSRAAKPDKAKDFWSVEADAQVIAKVIALYAAKNSRTASPKYLLGESYGGFRAVKVARALAREQGMFVTGIVMVSPFLDGRLTFADGRSALGAALQFPSLAAATLDQQGRFSPEALAEAERFAMTDYLVTLASRPPDPGSGRAFYARVAELTGLPLDIVVRARGFVRDAYVKHARGAQGEVVSSYDATFGAPDPVPELPSAEGPDPILDGYTLALSGMFVGYARDVLGFKTEMTYTLLNREVAGKWDWGGRGGRTRASVAHDLRELLALNPRLSVLIAHGRSDIVTPYAVTRYLIDHIPDIGGPDRIQLKLYRFGHMFYFHADARAAFTADAAAFYRRAGL
jgi:carboxypeptidase C (cathepsin A)